MADITYLDKNKNINDGVRNLWRDSDANDVKAAVNSKLDKVEGKVLSTNDYTDNDKLKVDAVPDNITAQLAGKQPLDSDLTAVAAIDSTGSGVLASDGLGWFLKTYAAIKTALGLSKSDVGLGNVDNTSDVNKPTSTAQAASIATAISNLKDGVASAGDTLQKLYNLCLGATAQVNVANIAARDAYNVPRLPLNVFVTDDGDSRWALYQATTTGVGATFVKLSDPDLLNAVMSASQIKVAYESNADTNAFTNALLTKLNGIVAGATANDTDVNLKNRANHKGTQLASTISDFAATVRGVVLTGLSTATNTAVTAANTVLEAIGLLQKQITDLTASKDDIVAATESLATTGTVTLDFDKKRASAITLSGNTTFALGTVNRGVPKLIRITPNGFIFNFTSVFKVTGTAQAGVVNSVYFLCYDSSTVEVDITQRT